MTPQDLTRSPDTPPERLRELARRYPLEFGQNPAGPLLLLENPRFLCFHPVRLLQILRKEALPEWFVAALLSHPVKCVAQAAQLHVVFGAATEPFAGVCKPTTPRQPWRANRWQDRLLAAQAPETSRRQLHQLKRDGNRYVRFAAQKRLGNAPCG